MWPVAWKRLAGRRVLTRCTEASRGGEDAGKSELWKTQRGELELILLKMFLYHLLKGQDAYQELSMLAYRSTKEQNCGYLELYFSTDQTQCLTVKATVVQALTE